jgi:hypothetical protein
MRASEKAVGLTPAQKKKRTELQRKLDVTREELLTAAAIYNREALKLYAKVFKKLEAYGAACEEASAFAEVAAGDLLDDFSTTWASYPAIGPAFGETAEEEFEGTLLAISRETLLDETSAPAMFRAMPNDDSDEELERSSKELNGDDDEDFDV